jgi:predicted RND superfamily exporter protein
LSFQAIIISFCNSLDLAYDGHLRTNLQRAGGDRGMQNWEEQRELFPTRRKAVKEPPARPRIRPNVFARIARFASVNHLYILIAAAFLVAAMISFVALNTRLDFSKDLEISIDAATKEASDNLDAEFPATSTLMVIRVSSVDVALAKNAAQVIQDNLQSDEANFSHAFIPGIGPFYDQFGLLYRSPEEITQRVQRIAQSKALYEAIAASPNLAGLSALVGEVASAVQKGRSPGGLEELFTQTANTIKLKLANRPLPMDWRKVAGLIAENSSADWVVVAVPRGNKLKEARRIVEELAASASSNQPDLKIAMDFPPGSEAEAAPSSVRQFLVALFLSVLFSILLVIFSLRELRTIVLVVVPALLACLFSVAIADIFSIELNSVTALAFLSTLLPALVLACTFVTGLAPLRIQAGTSISQIMLAAQNMGPLMLAAAAITLCMWLAFAGVGIPNVSTLAVAVAVATLAALLATLLLVPALGKAWPMPAIVLVDIDVAAPHRAWALWYKVRPMLAFIILAVCFFCTVFILSLRFETADSTAADSEEFSSRRGLQFMVDDEAEAAKLANDLAKLPEVGAVRWMGAFMPQDVAPKQQALRALSGLMPPTNNSGSLGPDNAVDDIQNIIASLRSVADDLKADDALRQSAQEFRRTLEILANTSNDLDSTIIELEQLLFSGFGELSHAAEQIAVLPAPKITNLDQRLRSLFVSEAGKWRIEALPKRVLPAADFIASVHSVGVTPLGPLVVEQAKLSTLKSGTGPSLLAGLFGALVISLIYLRNLVDWLIVVLGSLMPLTFFAAIAVYEGIAISPITLPALIMAMTAGTISALYIVVRRKNPAVTPVNAFLPAAIIIAVVVPFGLLEIVEFERFAAITALLIASACVFNFTVLQQICDWLENSGGSGPGLQQPTVVTQSQEYLGG